MTRRDEIIVGLRARVAELEEALREIRRCMGGDDPASAGWDAPEDVWEIADTALAKGAKE